MKNITLNFFLTLSIVFLGNCLKSQTIADSIQEKAVNKIVPINQNDWRSDERAYIATPYDKQLREDYISFRDFPLKAQNYILSKHPNYLAYNRILKKVQVINELQYVANFDSLQESLRLIFSEKGEIRSIVWFCKKKKVGGRKQVAYPF